jgi:hypothetical protein
MTMTRVKMFNLNQILSAAARASGTRYIHSLTVLTH